MSNVHDRSDPFISGLRTRTVHVFLTSSIRAACPVMMKFNYPRTGTQWRRRGWWWWWWWWCLYHKQFSVTA